jgi:DNA-binding CsgD family transcriptional regulator
MPKLDGIQATRRIDKTPSGFLLKDSGPAELLHAIRVVAAGDALLAPRITRRLIAQFAAQRTAARDGENRLAVVTEREREVLALVAQGLSSDDIGAELYLSPATARTHVSHAMVKLGARDRAQLVVIAYQTGLVSPSNEHRRLARWNVGAVEPLDQEREAGVEPVGRRLARPGSDLDVHADVGSLRPERASSHNTAPETPVSVAAPDNRDWDWEREQGRGPPKKISAVQLASH